RGEALQPARLRFLRARARDAAPGRVRLPPRDDSLPGRRGGAAPGDRGDLLDPPAARTLREGGRGIHPDRPGGSRTRRPGTGRAPGEVGRRRGRRRARLGLGGADAPAARLTRRPLLGPLRAPCQVLRKCGATSSANAWMSSRKYGVKSMKMKWVT